MDSSISGKTDDHGPVPVDSDSPSAAPFYIPYKANNNFVLRPKLSTRLDDLLRYDKHHQRAALCGPGGSGKTQLALHYAYQRYAEGGVSVFWISAENEGTFIRDYQAIAQVLGLPLDRPAVNDTFVAVRDAIQEQPQWLFVVDDVENLELFGMSNPTSEQGQKQKQEETQLAHASHHFRKLIRPWRHIRRKNSPPSTIGMEDRLENMSLAPEPLVTRDKIRLQGVFPSGPGGSLLLISRDTGVLGTLVSMKQNVQVAEMTSDQGTQLFLRSMNQADEGAAMTDSARALVSAAQWLPLTICQAAAYIRETQMEVSDFTKAILKDDRGSPDSVSKVWDLSLERIRAEDNLAYDILHVVAFLDPLSIPYEALEHAANLLQEHKDAKVAPMGTTAVPQAVKRLEDFHLLVRVSEDNSPPSYELPRPLQEAIHHRLHRLNSNKQSTSTTNSALEEPAGGLRLSRDSYARCAWQLVCNLFPDYKEENTELWDDCAKYLSHGICVAEKAGLDVPGGHVAAGTLLAHMSTYSFNRGLGTRLRRFNIASLALLRDALGEDDRFVLQMKAQLARVYLGSSMFDECEEILKTLLPACQQKLGNDDEITYNAISIYAALHQARGRMEEAAELGVQMYESRLRTHGELHEETFSAAIYLAGRYILLEQIQKHNDLVSKVLEGRRQLLGAAHPNTTETALELIYSYYAQERYSEAEELIISCLKEMNRSSQAAAQDQDEVDTANVPTATHNEEGYHRALEELLSRMLEEKKQRLGPSHPQVVVMISNLGITYYTNSRYKDSEEILSYLLKLRLEISGEIHPDTVTTQLFLALSIQAQGNHERAITLFADVLEKQRQLYGEEHKETVFTSTFLGLSYQLSGNFTKAEEMQTWVLDQNRKRLGNEHEMTTTAMIALAITLRDAGHSRKAIKLYRECLEIRTKVLGPDHEDTKLAEAGLNGVIAQKG